MKIISKKHIKSPYRKTCVLCGHPIQENNKHLQTIYEDECEYGESYIRNTHISCSNLIYDMKMNDGNGITERDFIKNIDSFFEKETGLSRRSRTYIYKIQFVKNKFGY